MAVRMYHGTSYHHHESIMRHGLRPAACCDGPFVTSDRLEALGYAVTAAQEHRRLSGDQNAKVIVYHLSIPEDRLHPAKTDTERRVPGGAPREWFLRAELGNIPADPEFTDEFAVFGRRWWRTVDIAGAAGLRLSPSEVLRIATLMPMIPPADLDPNRFR